MRRFFTFISLGFIFSQVSAQQSSALIPEASNPTDLPEAIEIKVFPNPTSSTLYFNISERMTGNTVHIFSVLGTELMNYQLQSSHDAMDVSPLQEGIYLYRIIDKNEKTVVTGKFDKR